MLKHRIIKQKKITVEGIELIYSVTEYSDKIVLRVYKKMSKLVWLKLDFSFTQAWSIYLYRPKTVSYLVKLCQQNYDCSSELELTVSETSGFIKDVLQLYYNELLCYIDDWINSLSYLNSSEIELEKSTNEGLTYVIKSDAVEEKLIVKLNCSQKEYESAIFLELRSSDGIIKETYQQSAILPNQELNQKLSEFLTKLEVY